MRHTFSPFHTCWHGPHVFRYDQVHFKHFSVSLSKAGTNEAGRWCAWGQQCSAHALPDSVVLTEGAAVGWNWAVSLGGQSEDAGDRPPAGLRRWALFDPPPAVTTSLRNIVHLSCAGAAGPADQGHGVQINSARSGRSLCFRPTAYSGSEKIRVKPLGSRPFWASSYQKHNVHEITWKWSTLKTTEWKFFTFAYAWKLIPFSHISESCLWWNSLLFFPGVIWPESTGAFCEHRLLPREPGGRGLGLWDASIINAI